MNREKLSKLFDEHFIDECDEVYDAHNEIVEYAEKAVKLFSISDVMKRIYLLVEEHNQLKVELDKSEEEMEELMNNGWDYIKLIGRKNEIEKAFDVIGLKYVS